MKALCSFTFKVTLYLSLSLVNFQTLSASDLRDPDISALIAAKLKEFHELNMPGPKDVTLWDRLRYISLFRPFFAVDCGTFL